MRHLRTRPFWQSLRLRLTLWYVALLAVILLLFSAILSVRLTDTLHDNLDDTLRNRANLLAGTITSDTGIPRLNSTRLPLDPNQGPQFVRLYDAAGNLVADIAAVNGPASATPTPALAGDVAAALRGMKSIRSTTVDGERQRVLTMPLRPTAQGVLQVGLSEDDIRETVRSLVTILATLIPLMLLIASGGGLFLARRALAPVDRITQAARAIEATDLHQRLPEPLTQDEISRLARTLNALIARLEAAFARQRQFTADASHELRTPLTIMRGELDVTLRRERDASEYRETLMTVHDEVARLQDLVADLLLLARNDEPTPQPTTLVDLDAVATSVMTHLQPLARARDQTLTLAASAVTVSGIAGDLERLVRNLVENAIRYTPAHGTIVLTVRQEGTRALITVADTGPGIDPAALPHLFDRFTRADSGRNRAAGGAGLGLAIAQAIARRHGGAITVASVVGAGSVFTVTLPLAPAG
ncbi:MAG: ATP-binding protein [Thermomicrobiales bacterium]